MTMPACAIEPTAADGSDPEDGAAEPTPCAEEHAEGYASHAITADPVIATEHVPPGGRGITDDLGFTGSQDAVAGRVLAGGGRESESDDVITGGRGIDTDPVATAVGGSESGRVATAVGGSETDRVTTAVGGSETDRVATAVRDSEADRLLAVGRGGDTDHLLTGDRRAHTDHPLTARRGGDTDHLLTGDRGRAAGCVITAGGAYAARLARAGDSWFPERWTLDGPEPYAVPLPGNQPEEPGTEVQPMADGRVLIRRSIEGRHAFSLLYPTGPGTGELPLGAVECPDEGTRLHLLPPAPCGERAYALAVGRRTTTVWLVAGGTFGPEYLAEVPGRCSGGVWLDRTGRMLALDREVGGRTKTIVVDLERGGEVSPLLQIAADSDDRLLLADPDSGLLLIRSDAPSPGEARLGWGVLGSTLPVRFPESLHPPDLALTPFASQPGQALLPEACAVALRIDGPFGTWVGVWRPADRRLHQLRAPEGWLAGSGVWTAEGVLRLPYATEAEPCGVAPLTAPLTEPPSSTPSASPSGGASPCGEPPPPTPAAARPIPLQQAPLGRLVTK